MLTASRNNFISKVWLRIFLGLVIIGSAILTSGIYNPNIFKVFIKAGLPLNSLTSLPILGDAIRAAESPQISVQELKKLIDAHDTSLLLVDVRSPEEYQYSHIQGAILVPLTDIEKGTGINKIKSLLPGHKLITYCSVGIRSNRALDNLRHASIQGTNLTGGITEWQRIIEPSMPEL